MAGSGQAHDRVWKRNLALVAASQFLSVGGFSFAMPFVPYYLQELGVTDPVRLKLWIGLFSAATPLAIVVASPIWGRLGDRYGRKLMLIRANIAATLVLVLMGCVQNAWQLVLLRLVQGLFTGTITAAQALVASGTPDRHAGRAMGWLSAAVFSGGMAGAFLGGIFADAFGYRMAFLAAGSMTVLAIGMTLAARELRLEDADDLVPGGGEAMELPRGEPVAIRRILLLILGLSFVRNVDIPYLPLRVQELMGGLVAGVATWSGTLSALAGLAGLLAGFILAPLADRHSILRLSLVYTLVAAALMAAQALAGSLGGLCVARFGVVFAGGGMEPVLLAALSRLSPRARRGHVFGLGASARSMGWFLSAVAGMAIAAWVGVQGLFLLTAAAYLGLALSVSRMQLRVGKV